MDESRSVRFLGLLRVLLHHGVDFFVVGGVAAQLEGAPILTLDLDVLYNKAPENLGRLLAALQELKARYRDPAGRHIEPDLTKLETLRTHLFHTNLGALNVLGAIGDGLTYQDLADRTVLYELGEARVRVLELQAVIDTKEYANREKDRAVLPVLRQTLALKNRSGQPCQAIPGLSRPRFTVKQPWFAVNTGRFVVNDPPLRRSAAVRHDLGPIRRESAPFRGNLEAISREWPAFVMNRPRSRRSLLRSRRTRSR